MMSMVTNLDRLHQTLRGNLRLRLGLWAIAGILGFYGGLLVQERTDALANDYLANLKKLDRARLDSRESVWLERAKEAGEQRFKLEDRLWQAPTQALAQAQFRDWVNQTLQRAGLQKATLTLIDVDETKGNAVSESNSWKVHLKADFDLNPKTFYGWLGVIKTYDRLIVLDSAKIRTQPSPRAEIHLVAHFLKARETQAGGAPASGVAR